MQASDLIGVWKLESNAGKPPAEDGIRTKLLRFKADGTLVSSKYEETDASLPEAVTTAIKNLGANDYKDYKLYSKKYFKTVHQGKLKEYYEITGISKTDNKTKKMITMDATGKVLKVS